MSLKIIDRIAEILRDPHAQHRLGGDYLNQLRNIVLSKDDSEAALAKMDRLILICNDCGKNFDTYEVAVHADGRIFCTNCMTPSHKACSEYRCSGSTRISDKLRQFFKRSSAKCPRHREGEVAEIPTPTVAPAVENAVWRNQRTTPATRTFGQVYEELTRLDRDALIPYDTETPARPEGDDDGPF